MASFRVFDKGEGKLEVQVAFRGIRGDNKKLSTGVQTAETLRAAVLDLQDRRWEQLRAQIPPSKN